MKTILGFDVSSTTTAYAALNWDEITNNITLIKVGYIKPIKEGLIIDRIASTRDQIKQIINDIKPDYIALEDIIAFMKGSSTANTVIMLTSFNRMIGLTSYDYLGRSPELFNVMTIRHGLKFGKILPSKQDMPELVAKHLNIKFPYEYNKNGKQIIENEDKADAMSVALYYTYLLSGKIIRKIKKPKLKKSTKKVKKK